MAMKEDKKKKKFKLRNPFKNSEKKKAAKESKSNNVSSAETPPKITPVIDNGAYKAPAPREVSAIDSKSKYEETESQETDSIKEVVEEKKISPTTNEGWACFEAKPVEELPMPIARSRRQLTKGRQHNDEEINKSKETNFSFDESSASRVSVEMEEDGVEVEVSPRRDGPELIVEEKPNDNEEEATGVAAPSFLTIDYVGDSIEKSHVAVEPEDLLPSDMSDGGPTFVAEEEIQKLEHEVTRIQDMIDSIETPMSDNNDQVAEPRDLVSGPPASSRDSDTDNNWSQFGPSSVDVSSENGLKSFEDLDPVTDTAFGNNNFEISNERNSEPIDLDVTVEADEIVDLESTGSESEATSDDSSQNSQDFDVQQVESEAQYEAESTPDMHQPFLKESSTRKTDVKASLVPLITTSSMLTEKAGHPRKVFAESMRNYAAGMNDKNILEAFDEIDEKLQERDSSIYFSDSFTENSETDSESMSLRNPDEKARTMRFVPTMSPSGETELEAVYEDAELDSRGMSRMDAASTGNTSVENDEALLSNKFLAGLWREADPPSVTDDLTVSTMTRDVPSVFSSSAEGFGLHTPNGMGHTEQAKPVELSADVSAAESRDQTDASIGYDTFDSRAHTVDSSPQADQTDASIGYDTYDSRAYTNDSRSYRRYDDTSTQYTGGSRSYQRYDDTSTQAEQSDDDYTYSSRMTGATFETNDDTYATHDTGVTGYSNAVGTRTTDYTGDSSVDEGRSRRRSRRRKSGRKKTASSTTSRHRTPGSDSDYDDDETVGTEYTNNYREPSTLDELADMAEELRQSGPGVIMNWLS